MKKRMIFPQNDDKTDMSDDKTDMSWETEFNSTLKRYAALVAAQEREACAKVCDERAAAHPIGSDEQCEAEDCAATIRARGEA